jgi:shikimate 5-dehydrogenase
MPHKSAVAAAVDELTAVAAALGSVNTVVRHGARLVGHSTDGAGFIAARFITHDAFDRRPRGLTILNIAHELVTVLVMALIIGVWPPAGV